MVFNNKDSSIEAGTSASLLSSSLELYASASDLYKRGHPAVNNSIH